jgi:hypothetical protein
MTDLHAEDDAGLTPEIAACGGRNLRMVPQRRQAMAQVGHGVAGVGARPQVGLPCDHVATRRAEARLAGHRHFLVVRSRRLPGEAQHSQRRCVVLDDEGWCTLGAHYEGDVEVYVPADSDDGDLAWLTCECTAS